MRASWDKQHGELLRGHEFGQTKSDAKSANGYVVEITDVEVSGVRELR